MPLLTSPIDGSPMRQINRYGIEIDVCPTTGGVWLDKGELEKILHFIEQELNSEHQNYQSDAPRQQENYQNQNYQSQEYRDDKDNHYREKGYYGSGKYHKKKGAFSRVMDLFDF